MSNWATWVVKGCADNAICNKVASGQCEGPSVPNWLQVQDFVDPVAQEDEFTASAVSWDNMANTGDFACTNTNTPDCAISGDQTAFAADWRQQVQAETCANVWPPTASSDKLNLRLDTTGATAPGADEYCDGDPIKFDRHATGTRTQTGWSRMLVPLGVTPLQSSRRPTILMPQPTTLRTPAGVHDSDAPSCSGTALPTTSRARQTKLLGSVSLNKHTPSAIWIPSQTIQLSVELIGLCLC